MALAKQNQLTRMHFTVFAADGITPLTGQAGACTSYLALDNATAPEAVTIAEIGATGHYHASFTPLSVGEYDLEVTCPDGRVMGESYEVLAHDIDEIWTDTDAVDTRLPSDPADQSLLMAEHGTTQGDIAALNDISAADVKAQADQALTDYDPPTRTEATADKDEVIVEVNANETKIDALAVKIDRALGLMFENHVMDDYVYTGTKMDSAIMYLYDSKANATTHDKVTGLVAKYTVTATRTGDNVTLFKVVLEP